MSRIGQTAPYLDGVPVVANSTQRDAFFPSPDTHQRVQNLNTGYIERWDGAAWQQEMQSVNASAAPAFNVRVAPFNARGDGATDDTTAIQAAINAANSVGGGVVYLPAGTYIISDLYQSTKCLALPSNVSLIGAGAYKSILKIAASLNRTIYAIMNKNCADNLTGNARHDSNITIRDLQITSATVGTLSGGNTHRGIAFWPVTAFLIENVYIHDLPDDGTTEHFGIYVSGDDAGNTTTFSRCDGLIFGCRTDNCGTGIGVQNTAGVKIIGCRAKSNKRFQGFTFSANGGGISTYDCVIQGCDADSNGNGIEIETSTVAVIGNYTHSNDNAGIRLTAGSSHCRVQGNDVYNNNQNNTAGVRNAGIVLDNIAALPFDNVITGNRCHDTLGAGGTQLYGIGQDTAVQGSNNLIVNNNCRGNKTAPTLNVTALTQSIAPGGSYNLTAAAAVPTGLTATYKVETDAHLILTFNGTVDFTAGTAACNLSDEIAAFIRVDSVNASSAAITRCVVAATGKAQLTTTCRTTVTAGSHTIDATVWNNTGAARGQLGNFNIAVQIIPYQQ